MSNNREPSIAYFMSLTRCQRDDAVHYLVKNNWRLDQSLDLFFEQNYNDGKSKVFSEVIDLSHRMNEWRPNMCATRYTPLLSRSGSRTIIIPTMIEFQRFVETLNISATNLLENSSKMMNLAIIYATRKQINIASDQVEHWKMHVEADYTRLQTLLDNEMCAPLVWIEHFEQLLYGDISQLFDCDYMFTIDEDEMKREQTDH